MTDPADEFRRDLAQVLNRHCRESESDTPGFLLADYIIVCLRALEGAGNSRAKRYGRHDHPGKSSDACVIEGMPANLLPESN